MSRKKVTTSQLPYWATAISETRRNAGLSRKAFAQKLGVTEKYIYMVETGRRKPAHRLIELLGYKFRMETMQGTAERNVDLRALVNRLQADQTTQNLLALYEELDPSGRDNLWSVALSERGKGERVILIKESMVEDFSCLALALHDAEHPSRSLLPNKLAPDTASLVTLWTDMNEEERQTLVRCARGLRSGDDQVRTHLIGQLKIIEEAVTARRAAVAEKEQNRRQAG